jgi:ABC-type multidrug transport system fused ATPase/permease subunit
MFFNISSMSVELTSPSSSTPLLLSDRILSATSALSSSAPPVPLSKRSSLSEFSSVSLSWSNISYEVEVAKENSGMLGRLIGKQQEKIQVVEKKKILDQVTGTVKPGTLLGIMGASGAGKRD